MDIYNFDEINFLIEILSHAKIIIILNYKKIFIQNNLIIKKGF